MAAMGFELASNRAKRASGLRTLKYQQYQHVAYGLAVESLAQQLLFQSSSLSALGSVSIAPIMISN
jgi:hypothetical protein